MCHWQLPNASFNFLCITASTLQGNKTAQDGSNTLVSLHSHTVTHLMIPSRPSFKARSYFCPNITNCSYRWGQGFSIFISSLTQSCIYLLLEQAQKSAWTSSWVAHCWRALPWPARPPHRSEWREHPRDGSWCGTHWTAATSPSCVSPTDRQRHFSCSDFSTALYTLCWPESQLSPKEPSPEAQKKYRNPEASFTENSLSELTFHLKLFTAIQVFLRVLKQHTTYYPSFPAVLKSTTYFKALFFLRACERDRI